MGVELSARSTSTCAHVLHVRARTTSAHECSFTHARAHTRTDGRTRKHLCSRTRTHIPSQRTHPNSTHLQMVDLFSQAVERLRREGRRSRAKMQQPHPAPRCANEIDLGRPGEGNAHSRSRRNERAQSSLLLVTIEWCASSGPRWLWLQSGVPAQGPAQRDPRYRSLSN